MILEAPPGFEPGMEVLQTSALPLGDGADRVWGPCDECATSLQGSYGPVQTAEAHGGASDRRCLREAREGTWAHPVQEWSGKRDSNPRLRPWQGRTLPLSYSRPNDQSTIKGGPNARRRRLLPAPSG